MTHRIGYANHDATKTHIVQRTEGADPASHRLLCTKVPGTQTGTGADEAVDCDRCLKQARRRENPYL